MTTATRQYYTVEVLNPELWYMYTLNTAYGPLTTKDVESLQNRMRKMGAFTKWTPVGQGQGYEKEAKLTLLLYLVAENLKEIENDKEAREWVKYKRVRNLNAKGVTLKRQGKLAA